LICFIAYVTSHLDIATTDLNPTTTSSDSIVVVKETKQKVSNGKMPSDDEDVLIDDDSEDEDGDVAEDEGSTATTKTLVSPHQGRLYDILKNDKDHLMYYSSVAAGKSGGGIYKNVELQDDVLVLKSQVESAGEDEESLNSKESSEKNVALEGNKINLKNQEISTAAPPTATTEGPIGSIKDVAIKLIVEEEKKIAKNTEELTEEEITSEATTVNKAKLVVEKILINSENDTRTIGKKLLTINPDNQPKKRSRRTIESETNDQQQKQSHKLNFFNVSIFATLAVLCSVLVATLFWLKRRRFTPNGMETRWAPN